MFVVESEKEQVAEKPVIMATVQKVNKIKLEVDTSMFWNIRQTLTHNMLINFIVGNRGGGKSYGAKEWCIDNFIKKREQFGYIRRYKDDLKEPMEKFFDDIKGIYPDYEFKVEKRKFYIRLKPADEKEPWTDEDIAGYGFWLSTADNKKSVPYPFITTLIFDEFLLDDGLQTYIKNEPKKLLSLYETIARPGTNHPRVILFLLANALSVANPYFLYFNLKMPTKQDKNGKYIWKHPTRPILVEDVRNEKFIDAKKNTEFGQLIAGTDYADYSINNKFLLDDDTFIERKSTKARYYFTFLFNKKEYGVWMDESVGRMWVSEDIDPSFPMKYAITIKDHQPNTMLLKRLSQQGRLKFFVENFKIGNVYFENMNVKNISYEVLKMTVR